jgi:glucose/arabinose dehydrogenase
VDPSTAKLILSLDQPAANHNGGHIAFGPDGMLYIALGDGGATGNEAQTRSTLFGSILRVDVDAAGAYDIPPDNPFVGVSGVREEIWAYGLRNPWRFAFDAVGGLLYIADVGQDDWEEVDVVGATQGGLNFGWNVMEGAHCFAAASCNTAGLTLPVLEYGHSEGCSITGGYTYRGTAIAGYAGHYFYADLCDGWVRSFRYQGAVTQERQHDLGALGQILSFGVDAQGELYILSANGTVYRLVPG